MPHSNEEQADNEFDLQDAYDDEITDEDYGFVFGPDGALKSVFVPPELMDSIPETVMQVFKLCGIENPHNVYIHTIH